jgi:regulator of replication initiation timing
MKTRLASAQTGLPFVVLGLGLLAGGCGDRSSKQLQAENEALRAEAAVLKSRLADAEAAREADAKRGDADAQGVARLRGEITQLRTAAKDAEKLRTENQQLRTENQKLRGTAAPAAPAPTPAAPPPQAGSFPRESWSFAGYQSPEAALVSAIWSMQQGNPKQYFDSLTPEEQLRMTKVWENKSQAEIVAKHQADTAAISGMRVTETQPVSAEETVMKVFIEGVNREEKVSMKRVGNEWRFNGFLREAVKP